jgi:streptomycin 6-kinase
VSPSAFVRDLPATVRARARDAGASAWLENLPELAAALASEWGLRLGAPFRDATEAYVVEATRRDGTPAVLKVLIPRRGIRSDHEIAFLEAAAGDGCCRLLAHDAARGALLVERLGPAMSDLSCRSRAASRSSPPCPRGVASHHGGSRTGAARAERMSRYISAKWTELGEPCTREAVEQALAAAESRRRAHTPDRAVLVHGDIHQWNALRAPAATASGWSTRTGWSRSRSATSAC